MESKNKYSIWIKIVSVAIPVVVAILFGVRVDYELPIFFTKENNPIILNT